MRRLAFAVLALGLAVPRTDAGTILYATAASVNRIDGFCLGADGSLAPSPTLQVPTLDEPRRLVVHGQVLYLVGINQVAAYRIGNRGGLTRIGATNPLAQMHARDIAFSPDGSTLYVPQFGYDRIAAYPLDAEGAPVGDFTSCAHGVLLINYLNVLVNGSLLYVSAEGQPGRIDVHPIAADGSLPTTMICRCSDGMWDTDRTPCTSASDCAATCADNGGAGECLDGCRNAADGSRPLSTKPISTRRRLQKPKAFFIADGVLYVEERALRRITAFQLQPDGTFCDTVLEEGEPEEPCAPFFQTRACARRQARQTRRRQQCPSSLTGAVLQYEDIVFTGDTILGTQFFKGRIDSYRLRPDNREGSPGVRLPRIPTRSSDEEVSMTPVRATVFGRALYVAAGILDQVIAYRLDQHGVLVGRQPFSRTVAQGNTFPNDVAVAVLPGPCG